jgi:hypothetical protein
MGIDATAIREAVLRRASGGRPSQEHPYVTGDTARRMVDALEGSLAN